MAYPLWQYAHELASKDGTPVELLSLDYCRAASAATHDGAHGVDGTDATDGGGGGAASAAGAAAGAAAGLRVRRRVQLPLAAGTVAVDAVAVDVAWWLRPPAGEQGEEEDDEDDEQQPYSSPYARHEIFFVPGGPRLGDAPLEVEVVVEGGALRVEFVAT